MDRKELNALMWLFTILLLLGFFITYKNLDGVNIVMDSKYEGLLISLVGLLGCVLTGIESSRGGAESFKSLYV